jgi:hypothetical protein
MHREQLIVSFRREHLHVGLRELHAQDQCFHAAEQQENKRGDDVADADFLVIDTAEEAADAGPGLPKLIQSLSEFGRGRHDCRSLRELRVWRHIN